jgi:lipoyl(octanoyl) transferase
MRQGRRACLIFAGKIIRKNKMKNFRLIRSGPQGASLNMELDEIIFRRYLADGVGTLRLYRWEKPSFTYGFRQAPESLLDLAACGTDGVEVAKRITGGGILFHDDEITYSFVCAKSDIGEPKRLLVDYRNICRFLVNFYESLGLRPGFAQEQPDFKYRSAPHEICSASHEKYDIVVSGKKIGGNAQKRNRQAIFQHGSIPCRINWDIASKYLKIPAAELAAGVTTLGNELSQLPAKDILEQKLIDAFSCVFKVNFTEEERFDREAGMVA